MRDYQQGSREREPLVRELYALGLSAQEIARLTKWSEATIAKDVKRLGGSLLLLDRPKRRHVFALVVRRYADYVMARAQKKLPPLDEQVCAALKEWLREDELLAVISGINYTMEHLLRPQYPPEREGYARLISSIFAGEGVFVQRIILHPAGAAEKATAEEIVWKALLIQIANSSELVPADRPALCRLLVKQVLAEERRRIKPIWDEQVFELVGQLLATLKPREEKCLRQRFGLDGHEPPTRDQVASELGVTRSRVRQIEGQALRKLRSMAHSPRWRLWVIAQPVGDALQREFKRRELEEATALIRKQNEEPFNPSLLEPVDGLNLSVRSVNCLQNLGIVLIGELVQLTDAVLVKSRNFGRLSLKEIRMRLADHGLDLGMKVDDRLRPFLQARRAEFVGLKRPAD